MEVILNQDLEGVGKAGAVARVKDGFARNFLFPKRLAVPLTARNLKNLEQEKQTKTLKLDKEKKEAEQLKDRLAGLSLTLPVLIQEKDKLYGSITSLEIQHALEEEGFNIDKNSIVLEEPIKSLGIYQVPVKLHPEVLAEIKLWVVKK
jgi:large subunit ribosomal protein L9